MPSPTTYEVKVADEVWIAVALLHQKYPEREDFSVDEIVARAREEGIAGKNRPGVYVHALQHCVANRPPNPARYCMLFETGKGRRRLWRPGDRLHPRRSGAKFVPAREDIPPQYRQLIDWYLSTYAKMTDKAGASDQILGLRGMGKEIWRGEHPDKYVRKLRGGWE
jgi:hypothetical protein